MFERVVDYQELEIEGLLSEIGALQSRLARLRALWRNAPAGLREFAGKHGESRAAWLREFEAALRGEEI